MLYITTNQKKVLISNFWTTNSIVSKESSGATEHYLKFHGQLNWLHLLKIKTKPKHYKRKVRVALEIQKTTCMTKRLKP